MSEEKKICECKDKKITTNIPDGYIGELKCDECNGFFKYPVDKKEYKGDNPIEEFFFNRDKNSKQIDSEGCKVLLLQEISETLKELVSTLGSVINQVNCQTSLKLGQNKNKNNEKNKKK